VLGRLERHGLRDRLRATAAEALLDVQLHLQRVATLQEELTPCRSARFSRPSTGRP
jgi:hypothetical protein